MHKKAHFFQNLASLLYTHALQVNCITCFSCFFFYFFPIYSEATNHLNLQYYKDYIY